MSAATTSRFEASRTESSRTSPSELTQSTGSKFASKYDTMADLERGQVTLFPNPGTSDVDGSDQERKDYSILFGRLYVHGIFHMPSKDRLTERFPELRPVRLEEFLTEAWRGK